MDKSYINLLKQIYEAKDLTLEPLGIKFKDLSADVLTTLLYPLLELEYEGIKLIDEELDTLKLQLTYELYKQYEKEDLVRVALIGGEYKKIYEELKEKELIIEDKHNLTIINNEEIFLTLKYDSRLLIMMSRDYNVLILAYAFDHIYHYNSLLTKDIADNQIFLKTDYNSKERLNSIPAFIFNILLNSLGLTHLELQFIKSLKYIQNKYINKVIEYANSNFVKSYVDDAYLNGRRPVTSVNKRFLKVNNLLRDYDLDLLKDLDYQKALEVYYVE